MWEKLNLAEMFFPVLTSLLGYIVTKGLGRIENFFKEVSSLREEIGKLKMINEAQWRNIEDLKHQVKDCKKS